MWWEYWEYIVAIVVVTIVCRLFWRMFWPEDRIVNSPREAAKKGCEARS